MTDRAQAIRDRLGRELRERREELGWTMDEVADALDVSTSIIARRESGTTRLDMGDVVPHCIVLGLDPVEFWKHVVRWVEAN